MRIVKWRRGARASARWFLVAAVMAALVIGSGATAAFGAMPRIPTELVSVATDGTQGDDWSGRPDISKGGRYVVFMSGAGNLSPDDQNGTDRVDVFLRDTQTGETTLLSKPRAGATQWDRGSKRPSISDDGKIIAFLSGQDLVASDTNNGVDLYIYEMDTGTYTRADATGDGSSALPGYGGYSEDVDVSGDGKYVVFTIDGSLTPGDTNTRKDVYRYDVAADSVTLVSATPGPASVTDKGATMGSISDDGRYVAFYTGRDFVAGDTNDTQDVYVRDMQTGTFHWLDVGGLGRNDGWLDVLMLSGNGRYVVFDFWWSELLPPEANGDGADVYRYDMETSELELVSGARDCGVEFDRGSRTPSISDDGRYVAFYTGKDLVGADTNGGQDFYVRDMMTGAVSRVDLAGDGSSIGDDVWDTALSGDGVALAFVAEEDFLPGDTNDEDDVFVRPLQQMLPDGSVRWAGATRYDTAVAVSEGTFPDGGASTVVVATGDNWPDALCGSALAGAEEAPILLTPAGALPQSVKDEIDRLGAENAYILGGTGVVSSAVETELDGMLDGFVNRLAGANRYATSMVVADKTIQLLGGDNWCGPAIVTTGENFADALAGAPLASGLGWPVLLANPVTGDVQTPAGMTEAVILGGTGAVPTTVEMVLKQQPQLSNDDVTRVGGATRYDTAAMTAEFGVDNGLMWNGTGLATGENFPDGLTGGASLGLNRTVMLLTPTASLAPAASMKLTDNKDEITTVQFFGGPGAVSPAVENQVKSILGM